MDPRHAAALTLVGWYLMMPFPDDLSAPIAYWMHSDSFDSATECRDAASKLRARAQNNPSLPKAQIKAISSAECIASDDPRLKGEK